MGYVQYTHDGGNMGKLVRVLPELFSARPTDFTELAKRRELYFVFYPFDYALRNNSAEIVSHQDVPSWAQPYPLMRWPGAHDEGGKTVVWKIFRASDPLTLETHQRTPVIRRLSPEQQKLSIHHLWPHAVMVRQLARGWIPERAEELRLEDAVENVGREKNQVPEDESSEKIMRHYLYFPEKSDAEKAGAALRNQGFSVEIRKGAGGEDWLALAIKRSPATSEDIDETRDEMESLAAQFSGEYDGWEITLDSTAPRAGRKDQTVN